MAKKIGKLSSDDLIPVVRKLVGPIAATGEEHVDLDRIENLIELGWLIDALLEDMHVAANSAKRDEQSMQAIGRKAREFLRHYGILVE